MALSTKAVTVFATLEALRDNQPDIRYPLATLFEPDLAKFNGGVFDPKALAQEINAQYHLGVTKEVIEGFLPIFEQRGWVQKIVDTGQGVGFVVQCLPTTQIPSELSSFQEAAAKLVEEFREFIRQLSPISEVNKTDAELIDGLVDWLLLLDRAGGNNIQKATTHYKVGKKILLDVPDNVEGGAPSEETFLSARFVEHLFQSGSEHIPFLIELSEVGLVTEVVRDFQRPGSAVEKTNLAIYLDAPLAMDFLGLSGKPQRDSVRLMFDGIKKAGGSIRIFRESVSEMQGSLHALLSRPVSHRTGPTADALRRREVLEPWVREVAARPERFLAPLGVGVVEETLDMYPNQHKFFTKDAYELLYSQIGWVKDDAARHHDALIATLSFRKRAGARSSDLFETKHVVVTRNPAFPNLARRIAREQNYIGETHVGPVIHSRQLATAVWLRMGAQDKAEIPRSYILSACRRVLTLRKNIVEKVSEFKETLSDEQAEQLEILITSDRSAQVLMDKTLGSSNIIDAKNIPTLLEEMKKAQIAEYAQERDAEKAMIEKEAERREADLNALAREEKKRAEIAQADANKHREKVRGVYERVVETTNAKILRERLAFIATTTCLIGLSTAIGFISQGAEPIIGYLAFAAILILGVLVHLFSSLGSIVIDPWFKKRDHSKLGRTALDFGLGFDDIFEYVTHKGHSFVLNSNLDEVI